MHWKKSLLVIHKFLRLFVNTLTVDDKHYLLNRDNLTQPIQMQVSQKQKTFSQFFFHFANLYEILNICQQKMTLIPNVFAEIPAPKNIVRLSKHCLKSRVSKDPSTDEIANGSKDCCNINESMFTIFINHCEGNYVRKSCF